VCSNLAISKITPEEMLEEIGGKLIVYLKNGTLNMDSFLNKIDMNIDDMDQLLRIHFLLKDKVRKFIEKLPNRIRNIKTSTQKINRQLKGEVRGKIDWQETIRYRCNTNYKDSTTFVCQQTNKDFNIKENLVLKKLLNIIHSIIFQDLDASPENYSWLSSWLGEGNLAYSLDEIYYRNIYLNKIDISEVIISDRMIQDTKKSRNILYQEAAELLEYYKYFINEEGWKEDQAEIISLLNETFIKPQKESVLFELYWVIKIIQYNSQNYRLKLIDGSKNLIASWTDNNLRYNIYHDSIGSSRINWSVDLDELKNIENKFFKRKILSRRKAREISEIFKSKIDSKYWTGRPDIVIEIINENKDRLEKIVIGEVKYTNRESTAKEGLKELLDYMQLVRTKDSNKYINNNIGIVGLLLLDNINLKNEMTFKGLKITNRNANPIEDDQIKIY
jgi:hypothetical protein